MKINKKVLLRCFLLPAIVAGIAGAFSTYKAIDKHSGMQSAGLQVLVPTDYEQRVTQTRGRGNSVIRSIDNYVEYCAEIEGEFYTFMESASSTLRTDDLDVVVDTVVNKKSVNLYVYYTKTDDEVTNIYASDTISSVREYMSKDLKNAFIVVPVIYGVAFIVCFLIALCSLDLFIIEEKKM